MADDVYQIQVFGALGSQPCENVMHYRWLSPGGVSEVVQAELGHLIDGWVTNIKPLFLACIPSTYTMQGIKARRVNNFGSMTLTFQSAGVGARTGTFSAGAIGPCILTSFFNGTNYRTGKLFIPGVSEADVDENVFVPGLTDAIRDLEDGLLADIVEAPNSYKFVVWSRSLGLSFDPLAMSLCGKPGVQNRRMRPSF